MRGCGFRAHRGSGPEPGKPAAGPRLLSLRNCDLRDFPCRPVSDLWNTPLEYRSPIPILLKWLPNIEHDGIKEDIVRGLSVKWARRQAARPLIEDFRRAAPGSTLQLAIANTLAVLDESVFDDVVELVRDRTNSSARQKLVVALGHMRRTGATTVLLDVLPDPDVTGHALIALGDQHATRAQPAIEPSPIRRHGSARKPEAPSRCGGLCEVW